MGKGFDPNRFGGKSYIERETRNALIKVAANWYNQGWKNINDWKGVYAHLQQANTNVEKMLEEQLAVFTGIDLTNQDLVEAFGSQSRVGLLLADLDQYIKVAELTQDDTAVHSVAMARLLREYLMDKVIVKQVTQKLPSEKAKKVAESLSMDFTSLRTGQQWGNFINSHNSLHKTLQAMLEHTPQGSFQHKYLTFLSNHARANDVYVEVVPANQMPAPNAMGLFNSAHGAIYIKRNLPIEDLFHTIAHEATHAYTTRTAYRYRNWRNAIAQNNGVALPYEQYGLNLEEVRFFESAEGLYNELRDSGEIDSSHPLYNELFPTRDQKSGKEYPYGVSMDISNPRSLSEFIAELYSNEHLRDYAAKVIAKKNQTSLKQAQSIIRSITQKFLGLFISFPSDNEIENFLQVGFRIFMRAPWAEPNGRASMAHLLQKNFTNTRDARTKAEEDQENGVRYYTFKRRQAFGDPELAGSARFNEDTGDWEFNYSTEEGQVVTVAGLNINDVMEMALDNDLQVYGRSGLEGTGHYLSNQLDRLKMAHPRIAKALENFRFFLMSFMNEGKVNNAISHLYEAVLTFEHYAMNRDSLHTWLERALRDAGRDPQNAQNTINDIMAKTQTFLNERGLDGNMTFKDHKVAIVEAAKAHGLTLQELNLLVYALTAKHRKALFDKDPGEINPYTGQPVRDGSLVSGFAWTDANGKQVKDDDGSKYIASLTGSKSQFVQKLEQMWIEQNNAVLDFELAAGAISRGQYEAQYGLFYAPLRNVDDQASAFYKRALGRTTLAKDPATNYYNFANARIMYAQHQMKMGALLDIALTENVQNILEVNQVHFVQSGDGLKKQWNKANVSDPATITVWRDNKQYVMRLTDKFVADRFHKMQDKEMTGAWAYLAAATRALSTVRTSLSPTFVPVAFARDVLTAMGNVQGAFRDLGNYSLKDHEARDISGRIPGRALTAAFSILGNKAKQTRSWEYDVFKRVGGGITMNAKYDFEVANDWLNQELRTGKEGTAVQIGTGLKAAKKGIKGAMEISHAFEDATRFATFMEYVELKHGSKFTSEQQLVDFLQANPELKKAAVTGSKNITGNFEIKGANVGWRAAYMFFNASMVGASTMVNMFDPRHGSHGFKFGLMIAGAMLASLAMVDADLGDDEDGKSMAHRINKLGDSICVKGVCIPVPHEGRWLTNFVTALYFSAKGDYTIGQGVAKTMHGVLQTGSPMQFDGLSTSGNTMHTLMQNLLPTIAELPFQLATGYNSFGKEIKSEYAYTANGQRIMNAMDWQKIKVSDPEWTRWLAMNAQKWLGLDVSSSEIDHTMQFVLGSVYTSLKKSGQAYFQGGSMSDVMYNFMGRSFGMNYDNRAMIDEMRNKLRKAKAELSMGNSVENMIRSSDELKADPRYAAVVKLEKQVEAAEKNLRFNGKSYSELFRLKQNAILTENVDAILEANEGIDELSRQRRELYGQFHDILDELLEGVYE